MPIAHVPIRICHTLDLAFVATEALCANTFRKASLLVQEAGSLCAACIPIPVLGALHGTLFAHESLFAFAGSRTLGGMLLALTPTFTTANATHCILRTAEATVTAHESFLAEALASVCSSRSALTLTRADATLVVLGARGFAFVAEETIFALAESHLFHSVVEAKAIASAD